MSLFIQCLFGTLPVPGWTSFCLQSCLKSSSHRFNRYWYWLQDHTVAANLSAAHANFLVHHSQRCFIGLRSDEAIWMPGNIMFKKNSLRWLWALCHHKAAQTTDTRQDNPCFRSLSSDPTSPMLQNKSGFIRHIFMNCFEILASLYEL